MKQEVTANSIFNAVSTVYQLKVEDLVCNTRRRNARQVSDARQVAAYLLKMHTDSSLKQIADTLSMSEKQNVTYSIKKIIGMLGQDIDFRLLVARIEVLMLEGICKGK